jgi:hypothetical protein
MSAPRACLAAKRLVGLVDVRPACLSGREEAIRPGVCPPRVPAWPRRGYSAWCMSAPRACLAAKRLLGLVYVGAPLGLSAVALVSAAWSFVAPAGRPPSVRRARPDTDARGRALDAAAAVWRSSVGPSAVALVSAAWSFCRSGGAATVGAPCPASYRRPARASDAPARRPVGGCLLSPIPIQCGCAVASRFAERSRPTLRCFIVAASSGWGDLPAASAPLCPAPLPSQRAWWSGARRRFAPGATLAAGHPLLPVIRCCRP